MCTLTGGEISARDRSFIQICKIEGLSPTECYTRGNIFGVDQPSRRLVFKVYLEIKKRTFRILPKEKPGKPIKSDYIQRVQEFVIDNPNYSTKFVAESLQK
jgi:hypothetical protein